MTPSHYARGACFILRYSLLVGDSAIVGHASDSACFQNRPRDGDTLCLGLRAYAGPPNFDAMPGDARPSSSP